LSKSVKPSSLEGELPAALEPYVERALPDLDNVPRRVRIRQTGEMWLKPGARPKSFTAVQEYSVDGVAFVWRAKFKIAGFATLKVVDRFRRGQGSLESKLFGSIPLTREKGPAVSEGQAFRYLGELPWVPQAFLANHEIEFKEIDARHVEVSTDSGGTRVALTIELGEDGDITGVSADARPRLEDKGTPTPWSGSFSDYAELSGVRLPRKAEVRWDLADGPFTYWSGEITGLDLIQ
jgi:hypothetical protein